MRPHVNNLAKLSALAVVAAHLTLTMAYNLPSNPLSQSILPLLQATIGTYFSQNWRLFAPQPATSDVSLVVGCVDAPELAQLSARHEAGQEVEWAGAWVDITAPLWTRHQQMRLSAYDRISRAQANAGRAYLQGPSGFESWSRACSNGESNVCAALSAIMLEYRSAQLVEIGRIASSYCRAQSEGVAGVALRVRERRAIPWSQRFDDAEPEVSDVYLGILPVDRDVAPATLYVHQ